MAFVPGASCSSSARCATAASDELMRSINVVSSPGSASARSSSESPIEADSGLGELVLEVEARQGRRSGGCGRSKPLASTTSASPAASRSRTVRVYCAPVLTAT